MIKKILKAGILLTFGVAMILVLLMWYKIRDKIYGDPLKEHIILWKGPKK